MFQQLIEERRSIRKYQKKAIEPEKIEWLIEAAVRAPSSRGINPWEFVVINDKRLLTQLAQSKPHGASFLKGAPLAVVVCADPRKSDVWVEDAVIAATFLQLSAADLDLGSCWIQIRKREHNCEKSARDYIAELLHIPKDLEIEAIIAIGYPDEDKAAHERSSLPFEKVSYNKYGMGRKNVYTHQD